MTLPAHLGLDVRLGDIPDELPDAVRPLPWLQTTSPAARVQFADGNALLVENGRHVTVQWNHDPTEGDVDLSWLVQGWSVTLASLQRGNLSLHASTVQIGDEVVALAGHQGAGKSTTAMGLRARGHRLLVDDTTVVEFRDDGAWTTPYARNVHLLRDTRRRARGGRRRAPVTRRPAREGRISGGGSPGGTPSDRSHRGADPPRGRDRGDPHRRARRRSHRSSPATRYPSRLGAGHPRPARILRSWSPSWPTAAPVQLLRRPPDDWSLDAVLDAIEAGRPDSRFHPPAKRRPASSGIAPRCTSLAESPPAPRTPWSP